MYAYVIGGGVVRVLPALPSRFLDIKGFDQLSPAELASHGVLPIVDLTPPVQEPYFKRGKRAVTVFADRVEVLDAIESIPLDLAKQLKLGEINNRVEFFMAQGFTASGHTWKTTPDERNALLAMSVLVLAGGTLPANYAVRDITDTPVQLTAQQLLALTQAVILRLYTVTSTAGNLRDQVAAAQTVADVVAINVP